MSEALEGLKQEIAEVRQILERHVGTEHAQLMLRSDILASDRRVQDMVESLQTGQDEIKRQLNEVADVVLGQQHIDFDGIAHREGGLIQWSEETAAGLEKLSRDYQNGGIRTRREPLKLSAGAWAAIGIAITTLGTIAVSLIQVAFG